METGSTRIYVVPRSGGGWQLREIPNGPVLSGTATKQAAVVRASVLLEAGTGGEVVVLSPDGSVGRTLAISPVARRWWYVRAGVRRWALPLLVAAQLLLRLTAGPPSPLDLGLGAGLVVLLALALGAVLRSRSLDRSRAPVDEVVDQVADEA